MAALDRIGILTRLALTKNAEFESEQQAAFMEVLDAAPVELLRAACIKLAKAQTFGMPTAGDILATCDVIQREKIQSIKSLPSHDESDRRTWVHCKFCNDDPSAWLPPRWCQGSGVGFVVAENSVLPICNCGREKSHAPHSFTERCTCHMDAWRNERRMHKLSEYAPQPEHRSRR